MQKPNSEKEGYTENRASSERRPYENGTAEEQKKMEMESYPAANAISPETIKAVAGNPELLQSVFNQALEGRSRHKTQFCCCPENLFFIILFSNVWITNQNAACINKC